MELLTQLELVEVSIKDGKATMTFLDEERGEVREVNFNKNIYDNEKNEWLPDAEKAIKVEEWAKEYFNLTFDTLAQAIGTKKDVYTYDRFNSLWFVEQIEKFDSDMIGQIFETQIESIEDDGKAIIIKFKYDDKDYASKMSYAEYMESLKRWFVNPIKQSKQFAKFETKFLVPFDEKDSLIGHNIMVEVKLAFGKFIYSEIKPLPKDKKKK